ncbi:hypothetical protein [Paenibacillus sp. DRB1-1]|uniref:hypothetical protein n=1 Tax=Paenibacillus sp. DRB1-1 TaxID=3422309 RepID=UPI003F99D49D
MNDFATQCIHGTCLAYINIGGMLVENTLDIHAFYAANARNKYVDKMAFWCSSSLGAYFIGFSHDATIRIYRPDRNAHGASYKCGQKANRKRISLPFLTMVTFP